MSRNRLYQSFSCLIDLSCHEISFHINLTNIAYIYKAIIDCFALPLSREWKDSQIWISLYLYSSWFISCKYIKIFLCIFVMMQSWIILIYVKLLQPHERLMEMKNRLKEEMNKNRKIKNSLIPNYDTHESYASKLVEMKNYFFPLMIKLD